MALRMHAGIIISGGLRTDGLWFCSRIGNGKNTKRNKTLIPTSNVGRSAYSASKAALISQSKTLSRELGPLNIRVNTIDPGLTNTDMMKDNTSADIIKEVTSKLSLKRMAEPDEIANVALFLASDLSSYVTGQVIRVDGGM